MKKIETNIEAKRVMDYIRPNLAECIYLYIDVAVYGVEDGTIDLWIDEDSNGIDLVIMRYQDSLQVYSHKNDWDKEQLFEIMKTYDVKNINAKVSMLDVLDDYLKDEYEKRKGWILKSKSLASVNIEAVSEVEVAKPEDAEEIASVMCTSDQWSKVYSQEKLAKQLADRMRTGMGRSLIIRDKGRIVAHDATFAETDDIVMGSGLIVLDEYVDRMYSAALGVAMDRMLEAEGKEKYFHISDPGRLRAFKRMGNKVVAETGKWMKK